MHCLCVFPGHVCARFSNIKVHPEHLHSQDRLIRALNLIIRTVLLIVYQKGDIVKDPMKSIPFLPKIVPGVGWRGVGWGGVG